MAHPRRQRHPWWLVTFPSIGLVSVCTVILTLFFPFGRRPPSLRVTAAPPVDSPDFLASVAGTAGSPPRAGGTAQLLNTGAPFSPALVRALRAARRTIHFSVYIWEPGQASD